MPDLKPSSVQIGVIEFFSVVLPGALLTAASLIAIDLPAFPRPALLASEGAQWVAFGITAYTLGHFVFLVAAGIDLPVYARYRNWRWPRRGDDAYSLALIARSRFFGRPDDTVASFPVNTFAWAKAMLALAAPAAAGNVERFEADSKFFRSLVVVLPLVGGLLFHAGLRAALPVAVALCALSFLRYAERRHKSTELAYQYVLVLSHLPDGGRGLKTDRAARPAGSASPPHR